MILVYKFGLLAPTENSVLVREQMHLAHRYRNTLVEIERGRRAALRSVFAGYDGVRRAEEAFAQADSVVEGAQKAIRAARSATRTRSETYEMRTAVLLAREARSATRVSLRQARMVAREQSESARDAIEESAGELRRNARAHSGLYWGSYLLVEDSDTAARKAPLFDGAEPNDPRFVRWNGEGRIGVQLQGGLGIDGVLAGEDTRFRVVAPPPMAPRKDGQARQMGKGALEARELWMRVGSTEDRAPVWARFPMRMHRAIPAGSVVKWAVASLRREGPRDRWSVEITVDTRREAERACGVGAVGLDVGWRVIGEELRVCAWHGEDGESGELRLSARLLSSLRKASELRSLRDDKFNVARLALVNWLSSRLLGAVLSPGQQLVDVPPWVLEVTKTLSQWRSAARLAALALRWRSNRFDGDSEAYDAIEAWRYHDHHLWDWECAQRRKSINHRCDNYRVFAADLASRYETLVVEDFDLRTVARYAPVEEEEAENLSARSHRVLAATSVLRAVLINAFRRRGGRVVVVCAVNTTRECLACGKITAFDAAASIVLECECGARFDQDDNAARNLLARHIERERLGVAEDPVGARKSEMASESGVVEESRWVKARRLSVEKRARKEGAREAGSNIAE